MMEKYIFKGIKQVTMGTYLSTVNKNGYLWFVREEIEKPEGSQSPFDVNRYHIYFGDKKYGESWNGLYEAIEAMASVINSNTDSISKKQDKIDDLETIREGAALGATALQAVPDEYVTDSELENKGFVTSDYVIESLKTKSDTGHTHPEYLTESELSNVATSGSYNDLTDKPVIPSIDGLATVTYVNQEIGKIQNSSYDDTEIKNQLANKADKTELFSKSYNNLTDKPTIPSVDGLASEEFVREEIEAIDYVTAVDTVEEVDGVSNDFVTSEQLDGRDYATNSSVNSQINTVNDSINGVKTRLTKVENLTSHDMRASVLWLGTSIPAGDINIDPQQNNTYPRMVADALGFDLYNMAKAGSFVAWYPQAPAWTTSTQVAAEFATAYSLSATRQEIYDKYYSVLETIRQNEGLSTTWRDDYLNDFMDSSFETRILPYIDGTIAKCDGVVIDHGFNDRGNIFNVCNQHVTADKDSISVWGPGSGAEGVEYPVIGGNAGWWWLTHLADNRYYDGEVYMNTVYAVANGLAGSDTGGMRGEYFGAMAYIIAKIQQVDSRIRIVIGNYFSQDYGSALGDNMNSFQTKYILQANQSIADYYGFPCVNVYKHTGLRNRTIRKPDGTTISDMYWFCPDGVHPSSDTTGLSNTIVASAYIAQIKGCFFKLG